MNTITHRHCGEAMLDFTEASDLRLGVRVWHCAECGERLEEADPQARPPRPRNRPTIPLVPLVSSA